MANLFSDACCFRVKEVTNDIIIIMIIIIVIVSYYRYITVANTTFILSSFHSDACGSIHLINIWFIVPLVCGIAIKESARWVAQFKYVLLQLLLNALDSWQSNQRMRLMLLTWAIFSSALLDFCYQSNTLSEKRDIVHKGICAFVATSICKPARRRLLVKTTLIKLSNSFTLLVPKAPCRLSSEIGMRTKHLWQHQLNRLNWPGACKQLLV